MWRYCCCAEGLHWHTHLQDQEQHESDLRGSRGVLLVGVLMLIMAFSNFRNTVRQICEIGRSHLHWPHILVYAVGVHLLSQVRLVRVFFLSTVCPRLGSECRLIRHAGGHYLRKAQVEGAARQARIPQKGVMSTWR